MLFGEIFRYWLELSPRLRNIIPNNVLIVVNIVLKLSNVWNEMLFLQNIPVEKQRLIFQGKVLQDEKPLQDYSKLNHS